MAKSYVLHVFTDLQLVAKDIYRFYKARFQIEFLFHDAKQFTDLNDCQARSRQVLNFHFNADMTAPNLIKLQDRLQGVLTAMSFPSLVGIYEMLMFTYFNASWLGFYFTFIKCKIGFDSLWNYGTVYM